MGRNAKELFRLDRPQVDEAEGEDQGPWWGSILDVSTWNVNNGRCRLPANMQIPGNLNVLSMLFNQFQ